MNVWDLEEYKTTCTCTVADSLYSYITLDKYIQKNQCKIAILHRSKPVEDSLYISVLPLLAFHIVLIQRKIKLKLCFMQTPPPPPTPFPVTYCDFKARWITSGLRYTQTTWLIFDKIAL